MAFVTRGRQLNIRKSDTYDDTVAPSEANFETNPTSTEGDFNNLRSALSHLKDGQSGDWYDVLVTPGTFEGGAQRGVDDVNTDLHELERKRLLDTVLQVGIAVSGGSGVTGVVLLTGELPGETTIAIGAVSTLGTVVAEASVFATFSATDIVAGDNALRPKNLVRLIDGTTLQPITSTAGREIAGLLQSESSSDGSTATDTTPNRLQISFVEANATGDGIQLIPSGDMDGVTFDYATTERFALDDLPETALLGPRFNDSGSSTATRQSGYDVQGTTPVDLTTNATLDLEGAGLAWSIRDDLEAALLTITEGSAGGTSTMTVESGVDVYQNSAIDVDFTAGITVREGGSRTIDLGVNDGVVESTAGDLGLLGFAELTLDDGNRSGSTFSTAMKFSDTTGEWDAFETQFGEVSVLAAMVAAATSSGSDPVRAVVTVDALADAEVGGVGGGTNLSAQLPDMSGGVFTAKYDIYLNGVFIWPGANAAADEDVYPGTSLANGQLKFEDDLFVGDTITVVARA